MATVKPQDLTSKVMEMSITGGLPRGYLTGWERMDATWSVRLGEMTLVTGIPGSGKSEWMDSLMVNLAKKHGFNFVIFSPENHPLEFHVSKLLEKVMKKPFSDGPTPKMELEDIEKGLKFMNKHFTFLAPEVHQLDPVSILNLAQEEIAKVPSDIPTALLIDPWNEVSKCPAGISETDYISQTLSTMRYWARDNNAHLFIVAHPTKMQKGQDGKYPCPTPYDIAGSAHWRNKADNCIAVHRPNIIDNPHWAEVHVQKVRFRHVGRIGTVEFTFNPANGCFTDIDPLHPNLR